MNDWALISGAVVLILTVIGFIFKWGWNIIQDVKKGVHARVERCEHVVDGIIDACNKKKEDYISNKAFDRFEHHLNTKFDGMNNNINHLTTRIDDFINNHRNGNV